MAAEETAPTSQTSPGGKGRLFAVLVVVLLMGAEGVGVFFIARAMSPPPASALATEDGSGDGEESNQSKADFAEIELAECRPSNMMAGKFVTYHIRVSALVAADDQDRAESLVRSKRARLEDGVNTVIRSAEPKHLGEPELGTIKRRLKHEFDQIFGDDQLIQKVLIPQMLQSSPGV